jgi:hypothetical protein
MSLDPSIQLGFEFELNDQGRSVRKIQTQWQDLFPSAAGRWLARTWNADDCQKIEQLAGTVVIGTHLKSQVDFLKNYFADKIETVGIVYNETAWAFVLKNLFTKVLESNQSLDDLYQQHPAEYKLFKRHNAIALRAFKAELEFPTSVVKSVNNEFDHCIDLEKLVAGDLQWAKSLIPMQGQQIFETWLKKQSPLFRYQIVGNFHYDRCMGRNACATEPCTGPIKLDLYDWLLINHYIKTHNLPPCKATTHQELIEFFEKL